MIRWLRKALGRLFEPSPEPWTPECAKARTELRRARSITWDYDKFRYHLDLALQLEREFQRQRMDELFKEVATSIAVMDALLESRK